MRCGSALGCLDAAPRCLLARLLYLKEPWHACARLTSYVQEVRGAVATGATRPGGVPAGSDDTGCEPIDSVWYVEVCGDDAPGPRLKQDLLESREAALTHTESHTQTVTHSLP